MPFPPSVVKLDMRRRIVLNARSPISHARSLPRQSGNISLIRTPRPCSRQGGICRPSRCRQAEPGMLPYAVSYVPEHQTNIHRSNGGLVRNCIRFRARCLPCAAYLMSLCETYKAVGQAKVRTDRSETGSAVFAFESRTSHWIPHLIAW